jgi:hypothetical protein
VLKQIPHRPIEEMRANQTEGTITDPEADIGMMTTNLKYK